MSRRTKAKRKLISEPVLAELIGKTTAGVPLSVALRQMNLIQHVSRPHASKLVDYYAVTISDCSTALTNDCIRNSLFPVWLVPNVAVQTQPDGWYYIGYFPFGEWCLLSESKRDLNLTNKEENKACQ